MNRQEIFDKVAAHLLAQNKKAESPQTGMCMYRSPDGLKCAMGALIPDDIYDPAFEGHAIDILISRYDRLDSLFDPECSDDFFLCSLQRVHDQNSPDTWAAVLSSVATTFGLVSP